ncbi:MAG: hypothetical protein AB7I04_18335 [Pseudomonadales bacterium]
MLAAMFTDGEVRWLEDGTELYVLREEWPEEVGMMDRYQARRAWKQLLGRKLVEYQAEDHMALSSRLRGSYSCQDRIVQFSDVRNRTSLFCTNSPLPEPLPEPEFESAARSLARARAITTDARAFPPPPTTSPPPPTSPPTPPPVPQRELPSVEEALTYCGVDNAGDQVTKWGWNNCAVALRELSSALSRARLGKQQPIESRAKYLMYQLRMGHGKRFEEVTDFSFLAMFAPCEEPGDERVRVFPTAKQED